MSQLHCVCIEHDVQGRAAAEAHWRVRRGGEGGRGRAGALSARAEAPEHRGRGALPAQQAIDGEYHHHHHHHHHNLSLL